MLRRRIGAAIAAMIVGLQMGIALAAEPTLEQLVEIRTILDANDVAALRAYLDLHPELLDGDTALAVLLRRFLSESVRFPDYLMDDSGVAALLGPGAEPDPGDSDGPGDDDRPRPGPPDDGIY